MDGKPAPEIERAAASRDKKHGDDGNERNCEPADHKSQARASLAKRKCG
ncbi:MAG TPA: hypothetical protein VHD57_13900 [Vicinamibacterales bacterium]|jgi:hypothetical protein|nr:hypothetical protein [Vicinamibacterales bacterium]